ncbi:hypothetical protein [Legionella brunensis]|uniref:Uncharacterized protein n=1 Tax=Legionella brunensis TaxID=29422 RepID=A0A0W0SKY8_9GAMM|nr:hypothetical protein [Legionella brunensis]KTC84048.1 hypothetical protein Lbru_1409 [Legionella brunensis]
MKTKRLASPQTVNACTLISVAVIEAILSARNEKEMDSKIKEAHKSSQMLYIEQLSHNKERGAGLLEEEAYQQYFSEFFKNPTTAVIAPNEINIKELLDNRDNLIRNGIFDLFFTYNYDTTEAIQKKLEAKANGKPAPIIDWATVTENELKQLLGNDEEKLSLEEEIVAICGQLQDPQGVSIRMEGHTIPLIKRGNVYYSYDSLTGILSSTEDLQEMTTHVLEKINTNRAKGAVLYYFSPQKIIDFKDNEAAEETKTEEKKITAEQIHDLIENRKLFDGTIYGLKGWQLVNGELFELIYTQIPEKKHSTIDWSSITEVELCQLINIEKEEATRAAKGTTEVVEETTKTEEKKITAEQIHDLIENRKLFDGQGLEGWQQLYAELFVSIYTQIPEERHSVIDWSSITEVELCQLMNIEKEEATRTAKGTTEVVEETTKTAGKKITAEEIHNLIEDRKLYMYNGRALNDWQQHHAKLFRSIYMQIPEQQHSKIDWSIITEKELCQLLNIEPKIIEVAKITAEEIHTLIEDRKWYNRHRFDDWQQKHARLFNLIYMQFPEERRRPTMNWASITEKELCQLLNIQVVEAQNSNRDKLLTIIDTLKDNIINQKNERKTSRNSQWKADLLSGIQQSLQQVEGGFTSVNEQEYIQQIRDVCSMKRNSLHFWSEPHSASEFEKLLQDNGFEASAKVSSQMK